MKNLVIVASLFALGVPAAFAAPPAGQGKQAATPSASQLCKQQRNTIGTRTCPPVMKCSFAA